jgi:hypothetical protein
MHAERSLEARADNERPRTTALRRLGNVAAGTLCVVAGAATAIEYGSPSQVEIAGQTITVKPEIGKSTISFTDPEIGSVRTPSNTSVFDVPIGVKVGGDVRAFLDQSDQVIESAVKQIINDPSPEKARVEAAARTYLIEQSALGGAVAGLTLAALTAFRRRQKGEHTPAATVGVLAGVTMLGGSFVAPVEMLASRDEPVVATAALAHTPLEGTQISISPEKGALITRLLTEPKTPVFDNAIKRFESIIETRPDLTEDGWDTYVFADDLESVNGMAKVTGALGSLLDARGIFILGDMTFSGRNIESAIIDTLVHSADDVPIFMTAGHHDTQTILNIAKKNGITIASGATEAFAGLRVLGLNDPEVSTISDFQSGSVQRSQTVTVGDFEKDAIAEVCDDTPQLVVGHDYRRMRVVAKTGCAPLVVDGRTFENIGLQQHRTLTGSSTVEYTVRSSGGHNNTAFSRGELQTTATLLIMKVHPETGEAQYAIATVPPHKAADISPSTYLTTLPETGKETRKAGSAYDANAAHPQNEDTLR